jgi:hypothetical protein
MKTKQNTEPTEAAALPAVSLPEGDLLQINVYALTEEQEEAFRLQALARIQRLFAKMSAKEAQQVVQFTHICHDNTPPWTPEENLIVELSKTIYTVPSRPKGRRNSAATSSWISSIAWALPCTLMRAMRCG